MTNTSINDKKYINKNIFKISHWVIVTSAIVHLDTFFSISNISGRVTNIIETKNLVLLSIFMLVSIIAFNFYRFLVLYTWLEISFSKWYRKLFSIEYSAEKKEGINYHDWLRGSIETKNEVAYDFYYKTINKKKESRNFFEFLGYLFLILSLNIISKGTLYNFLMSLDESITIHFIYLITTLLIITSYIIVQFSISSNNDKIHVYGLHNGFFEKKNH